MDTRIVLDLMEEGTRYEHYMELREAFATGAVILENTLKVEENLTSRANMKKLNQAVELIDSRIGYLASYVQKGAQYSPFGQMLRDIKPHRPAALPECSESTRRECEEEMRKAGETGYAEDGGKEGPQTNQGTSPKKP